MTLSKTEEAKIWKIYETWMNAYLNDDSYTYDSFLDDNYRFIGSTNNEEFLNRKETTEFFRVTGDQFAGMTDLRNETKTLEQFDDLIFLTHIFDAWFKNDKDWTYYGKFRFSSVMKERKKGWRFIYQHFSMPDAKSEEGQTIGFDKVNAENQELREAIQRRTTELEQKNRELEIEGALERIRAQAVAMQKSSDLLDIVVTMRNEFIKLGHEAHYFWHMMWLPETYEKAMTSGDGTRIGFVMKLPRHIHGDIPLLAKWEKSKKLTVVYAMTTQEAIEYVDKMIALGDFKNIDPQAPSHDDLKHIGGLTFIMARTTHGEIGYSLPGIVKNPPKADLDILVRFAGVFDLAHKRFLDLQIAENQARETQIELALEKVRSRTMAMQHSDELQETSFLLDQQVRALGIETWGCAFNIYGEKESTEWFGNEAGVLPTYTVPREGIFKKYYQKGQKGELLHIQEFSGDECVAHYEYMSSLPVIGNVLKKLKETNKGFPTYQIDHVVYFKYGYLLFITKEHVPEAHDVFKRFAKVFEQTYTRFLDLKKAEAQAREAQIEAALERVRSRAMAIRSSIDLDKVIQTIFQELGKLEINLTECSIVAYDNNQKDLIYWSTGPIGSAQPSSVKLQYIDHPLLENLFKDFKNGIKYRSGVLSGKVLKTWWQRVFTETDFRHSPKEFIDSWKKVKSICYSQFAMTHGFLEFLGESPLPEDKVEILKRFTNVVDLTYTRYDDVVKAEEQTREAQIEAALERVRSASMAMHKTEDLSEVVMVYFEQLKSLNIEFVQSWITIFHVDEGYVDVWFSPLEGIHATPKHFKMPSVLFEDTSIKSWKKGLPFSYISLTSKKEVDEFMSICDDVTSSNYFMTTQKKLQLKQLELLDANNRYGCISKSNVIKATKEEEEILQRFSKVFEQTYTRFLDLQKAEAQAREAQIQLSLERVRAKSMAMQSSDELHDVIGTVFQQFDNLAIQPVNVFLSLFDREKRILTYRASGKSGKRMPTKQDVDIDNIEALSDLYNKWINDSSDDIEVIFYPKEIVPDILYLLEVTFLAMPKKDRMTTKDFPNGGYSTLGYTPFGYLGYDHTRLPTEEEKDILKRICIEFGRVYQRFLDLEKAETQTRQAQINLAVERVRAKALAMHKSEEIMEVVAKLKDEVMSLDIPNVVAATIFLNEADDKVRMWDLSTLDISEKNDYEVPFDITFKLKKKDPHLYVKRVWENTDDYFVEIQKGKDFKRIIAWLRENDQIKVADEVEEYTESTQLKELYHAVKKLNNGKLVIDLMDPPSEEMETILTKMGAAFDLAYKRFEDLQRAEAQTREAQIEMALEKIRSRTMAMQESNELEDVAVLLYKELITLNVTNFVSCGYVEVNESTGRQLTWVTNPGGDSMALFYLPLTGDTTFDTRYKAWKVQQPVFHQTVAGKQRSDHLEYAITTFQSKEAEEMVLSQFPDPTVFYCFNFSHGYLHLVGGSLLTKEEEALLARFTKVFEQTYARFLDLQKAEAQAREAQIENALEKVRSRSLAMHKPDELQEVVAVVAEKLKELGVIFDAGGVILCTYFPNNKDVLHWIAVDDFSSSGRYFVPYFNNPIFSESWESKNRGDAYFSKEFSVEAKNEFFKHAFKNSDYRHFPDDYKEHVLKAEKHTLSAAWSKNSAIIIPSLTGDVPSDNHAEIIKRFAKVFEQAYIRFMDLQKAEAQARESQIEVALEKVRSRTMAMQHSDELPEAANNLFLQVQELGIPAWSAGYCIWEKDQKSALCHMSSEGEVQKAFSLPTIGEGYNFYDPYKNGETFHVSECGGKALVKHYDFMKTLPTVGAILEKLEEAGLSLPTFQIFHIVFFKFGYVMFITYESVPEAHGIFKRFGQVFEQTYTRFLDLKLKEEQATKLAKEKKRLEKTLSNLQTTQKQLIQSEKMASLGELTAGIAHEIQNPLNFVNNFSDVSKELLEEMQEEIDNGDLEEAKAIMEDVVQNLDKINHHGKRADSIVKGMLQHSRASGDKKEPTDINALADEYLRLAYHGLRAKDQSFNAELITDFDETIKTINVIPQDLGRVILNLLTNAFYVVNKRKKNDGKNFNPTVKISTKKHKKTIEITVEDNGNGMPESVREKIFQPFFTTKPTGEGTGLGLSLSYDIITKGHNGDLKVESTENQGTTFRIILPLIEN